jgi:YCII-related domain
MRFMIIVKATTNSEAGVLPSEKLIAETTKYNEELAKAGMLLVGEGLQASSKGAPRDRVSISAVFVLQFSREGLQLVENVGKRSPLDLTNYGESRCDS